MGREDQVTPGSPNTVMPEIVLTLPMLSDMELTAGKTASAMGEHIRMSPDKIDEIRMAVIEACINAFEHSHADDGRVSIGFKVLDRDGEPTGLEVTVRDRGVGFRPDKVATPDIGQKLQAKSKRGWGLQIIHGLMDEVVIESDTTGTSIVMRKML
ncbi:MAG: ATP-binding protein [Acidobacteriota bacterium]